MLAKFYRFVDIVALQVDLEVAPALRVDKVAYRPGVLEAFAPRQLYHAAAVSIAISPAARRHKGVYLAFVVCIACDDGPDVARRQAFGIKMDMVSATPVRRSAHVIQCGCSLANFIKPGLTLQNRADDLESSPHAGVADDLPVPARLVVISFFAYRNAYPG